ncbi:hypothetical protein [Paenibacillus sp. Marseille-Q4541]|uniref:hypothetical protein n=1 Tax=Paenibacillus sp. Marseille-Q4541 TaxID=2831522 RepID=UPI001BA4CB22|nr:hypothetical protein [Paenibacillus sp. Marseille-Q4541]
MKRKYTTQLSKKECISFVKDNVDFIRFDFSNEYFRGWTKLGIFSISYHDGKRERGRGVYNKAIGRISVKNGKTQVQFRLYKGWTDLFSILYTVMLSTFVVFISGPPFIPYAFLITLILLPIIMVPYTWLYTTLSNDGHYNEVTLLTYVERVFELQPVLEEQEVSSN